MANTTNFGWETPDDTDLVKDGAAAIRTLGSAIDTSLVDLKGGTTGQVLAKNSNTDMDFTWSSVDPLTILDAKGDLITATAADTPARLAVGTNGQYLQADSTASTGLKWATVNVNPYWDAIGNSALSGSGTVTINFSTRRANNILILIKGASPGTASTTIGLRINARSTAGDYEFYSNVLSMPATYATTQLTSSNNTTATSATIGKFSSNAASVINGAVWIAGGTANLSLPTFESHTASTDGGGNTGELHIVSGLQTVGAPITSVSLVLSSGNFDAGNIYVYGDQG